MAKPIPRVGLHKNVRSGSRKNARRIPKGVIHVQASFNNTIVTLTDVRGRVLSWSSASTCGFRGTRCHAPKYHTHTDTRSATQNRRTRNNNLNYPR